VFNVKVQKHKASLQGGSTQSSTTGTKIGVKSSIPHSALQSVTDHGVGVITFIMEYNIGLT